MIANANGHPGANKGAVADIAGGRPHIFLVGFMGAGKTTIGRMLAERTGRPFIDLDDLIVEKSGQTVAQIFHDHGEVGFRARERAVLREVINRTVPSVIATGGGTFVDDTMREWVKAAGRSIYLQASAEVLNGRLETTDERTRRPLLCGPDPEETIRRLLLEREPSYAESDMTVRTDDARIEHVVQELVAQLRLDRQRRAGEEPPTGPAGRGRRAATAAATGALGRHAGPKLSARTIEVVASNHTYQVHLQAEAGPWLAAEICKVCPGAHVALISDSTVAPLHANPLVRDLTDMGKRVSSHIIPAGEASKTLQTANQLYDQLIAKGMDRADAIVALGGGVVGDLSGFVASTLFRGVRLVQVPTTTLGAVDSSIGGKTAVNTPRGKNLVGTVYAPAAVLISVSHLATQPAREHAAGMAEALKMAATLDAALFDVLIHDAAKLRSCDPEPMLLALRRVVALKAEVVARDEHETSDRIVLNYGHTVGHGIEVGEEFRLLHGEAVALGMIAEAEWAETEGAPAQIRGLLNDGLRAFGLDADWRTKTIDIDAMGKDKKRIGGNIRLPVVPALGTYEIRTVPLAALVEYIKGRSQG